MLSARGDVSELREPLLCKMPPLKATPRSQAATSPTTCLVGAKAEAARWWHWDSTLTVECDFTTWWRLGFGYSRGSLISIEKMLWRNFGESGGWGRKQGSDVELTVANSDNPGRIRGRERCWDILIFLLCGIVNKCRCSSQKVRNANNRMGRWMNG